MYYTAATNLHKANAFLLWSWIVLLILSIVTLAGANQSKSTGVGKFNTYLSLFVFIIILTMPMIKKLPFDAFFNMLNVPEAHHMNAYFGIILFISALIVIFAGKNKVTEKKEKTQNTNAKRAATGISVMMIIFLIFKNMFNINLHYDLSGVVEQ
jgi:hypothetical protein